MDQSAGTAKYEPRPTIEQTEETEAVPPIAEQTERAIPFPQAWIDALEFTKHFAQEMQNIGGFRYRYAEPTFDGMIKLFEMLIRYP